MNDERLGLPSASDVEALMLCTGKHNACRGIPEPPPTEDATTGNNVHAYLAGKSDPLTDDEQATADACQRKETELIERHLMYVEQSYREQRLYLRDCGGSFVFSGKLDALFRRGDIGLLVDYKTGRNEVTDATGNMQLRALVVLTALTYGLTRVVVAIIQPWVTPQTSVCVYDQDDLERAELEMRAVLANAADPNAPRVPGEQQCRYCRAKSRCPEAIAYASQLPDVRGIGLPALDAETLGALLDRCSMAEHMIDAIRNESKARLRDGLPVPGWTLKPGNERETIVKLDEVYALSLIHI